MAKDPSPESELDRFSCPPRGETETSEDAPRPRGSERFFVFAVVVERQDVRDGALFKGDGVLLVHPLALHVGDDHFVEAGGERLDSTGHTPP